ncbi:hypothetical protein [Lentilactobacillus laojiaonis]|uniref:hypothetical protein n=1 Tax=Lentilactobacillus laojiaonis TaxID=2883998 RepID=UPI001D0BBFAE|nr:hypothetical protein [Lentilactobacillus laojiaonis]UDM31740.1 hypothetical protein LHL71_04110 [Lentilactobacillus laojiaonis]
MLVNILIIIAIIINLFVGGYLINHRNKPFFNLDPTKSDRLAKILKISGSILLFIGIIGIASLIIQSIIFIAVYLLVSTVALTSIQYLLTTMIFK